MNSKIQNSVYIPRRELTLAERVSIIKDHQNALRTGLIAEKHKCSKQQIRRILRRKDEYLALWAKSSNEQVVVVRRLRTPLLIATGRILYEWLIRARYYMDVSDENLRQTGRAIANHINYRDFKSNNRWLDRFKNKYKLQSMKLEGLHKAKTDSRLLKSLDIAEIIADIRRDDPTSLADLDKKEEEGESKNIEIRDLPDIPVPQYGDNDDSSGYYPLDQGIGMDDVEMDESGDNEDVDDCAKEIRSYKEAINLLGPIEQFALFKENVRAVGLINQLENLFRDEISKGNN